MEPCHDISAVQTVDHRQLNIEEEDAVNEQTKQTDIRVNGGGMNRYLVAVLVTAAAVLLRLALAEIPGPKPHSFVVLFIGAALAAAWFGGVRAGLLSTVLGTLALDFLFIEPRFSLRIDRTDDQAALLSLVITGLVGCLVRAITLADQPPHQSGPGRTPNFWWLGGFVVANLVAAGAGQGLKLIPGVSITFWPPSGIFVAALLLTDRTKWPWWVAGAGVAELIGNALWFHNPLHLAILYFAANAGTAMSAAYLARRAVGGASRLVRLHRLQSPQNAALFAVLAGGVAPVVSATIIATADAIIGKHTFRDAWVLVWLGDGTGLLLSAPLTLAAAYAWRHRGRIRAEKTVEFASTCGLTLLLSWLALRGYLPTVYMVLPVIVWAAVRFQLRGAWAMLTAVILTVAVVTRSGLGEFAGTPDQMRQQVVALQAFLGVCALTSLIVAGLSTQHVRALAKLRAANLLLEQRILVRTAALHQSEGRYRGILRQSPAGIVQTDATGCMTLVNDRWCEMLGYSEAELLGRSVVDVTHPSSVELTKQNVARLAAGGPDFQIEKNYGRKDGSHFPAQSNVSAVRSPTGEFLGLVAVVVDITERLRTEEALRENAALFSSLIAQAPMGTYVVDEQFRMRQVNAEAMPVFASVQPLIGRDFQEAVEILWGPDVGGQIAGIFRHTLATGERYISPPFTQQRHDIGIEQTYEWETQRVTLPDGKHGVVCYFHEVTERARATAALRASQERMRLAAEATGVGIWEWNVITNAIRWDAEMFRIYSIEPTPDGFVHYQDWRGAVLPEDLAENEAILQDTVRRCGQSTREFRIRRRSDGECRWIQAVETVRANHDGKAEWVLGTNLDVTERQVTAQALRDVDRRKDEFLATLAHELRNPLAPMRTAVELLRMKGPDIPELQWARDVIDRQTQAMSRLIVDLMDVSRINQGKITLKREQVELAKIVQGAVETSHPLIEEMGHELTVTLPPRTVIVDADLTRLAQVILNLLNNAAKYTERGGRIDLRAVQQGSDVLVSVTDTGIGIPADKLPTLFEMFSQVEGALSRSQGGLGIGLCLVKRLVEMHGGSIEARSAGPGRGSEFVVRLPIVMEQTYPRLASQHGDKAKSISNLRILVVDDNRDAAQSLAMLLTAMGNNVHTAHDGEEAVAAAGEYRPDVVLCDIGLPKLNGYEACRQMKEQAWDKKMILIAVTGWGQDEDRRKSEEAGFDHHLVKPVDLNNLSNLLLGDPKLSDTPTGKSGPLRVLVVDDMRDARHMLSTLLKASGHDVRTASDGLTALSVALDFQPNVVLMDNSMPGMSGLEVAKQMRLEPKLKDAMLIALTGHGDEDDRQRSLEAGFDHHLVKPANINVIRELLASLR